MSARMLRHAHHFNHVTLMPRAATIVSALLLALPATAIAQQRPGIRPIEEQKPARNTFGIQGAMLIPLGEFDTYIGNGYGLTIDYLRDLDASGAVQLRFEGGFLRYGHERERACSSCARRAST